MHATSKDTQIWHACISYSATAGMQGGLLFHFDQHIHLMSGFKAVKAGFRAVGLGAWQLFAQSTTSQSSQAARFAALRRSFSNDSHLLPLLFLVEQLWYWQVCMVAAQLAIIAAPNPQPRKWISYNLRQGVALLSGIKL